MVNVELKTELHLNLQRNVAMLSSSKSLMDSGVSQGYSIELLELSGNIDNCYGSVYLLVQ